MLGNRVLGTDARAADAFEASQGHPHAPTPQPLVEQGVAQGEAEAEGRKSEWGRLRIGVNVRVAEEALVEGAGGAVEELGVRLPHRARVVPAHAVAFNSAPLVYVLSDAKVASTRFPLKVAIEHSIGPAILHDVAKLRGWTGCRLDQLLPAAAFPLRSVSLALETGKT